jgi:hypothetical protein
MSDNPLLKFLKVAGGLALAAPALAACDRLCGACGACSAETATADDHAGCGAATSRDAMAEDRMPDEGAPAN